MSIKGLILDMLIYLLIAYVIDVGINFFKRLEFISTLKGEKGKIPRFYRDMKPKSAADALTQTIFKKKTPEEPIKNKLVLKPESTKKAKK